MRVNPDIDRICNALDRITKKYGQPIIDGPEIDWGQVICRMEFGPHWGSHPEFHNPDRPDSRDLMNCNRLERGEWPKWIVGCTKAKEADDA